MIGPLQTTTSAAPTALLFVLALFVSVVLSAVVLVKGVASYRRAGDPALLGLAVGILLLSGGATLVNVGLSNATGVPTWAVTVAADGTRLTGLAVVLAVIYGTRDVVTSEGATAAAVPLIGLAVPDALPLLTSSLTGLVGTFVAYQAYRGYRRNDSEPMLALAVGTILLTALPFLAAQGLLVAGATPATGALAAQACRIAGLLSVLVAFAR